MRRGALDRPQRRQVAALQNFDPTHDSYGSILLKKGLVNYRAELEDTRQLYLAAIAEHPVCMRQTVDQSQLFYLFNLEEQIPADHLLTSR